MTEERHRLIDALVKALTMMAFLMGVPLGYFKYINTLQQGFHVEEWNRRLDCYIDLSREMAGIASADSYDEAKKSILPFKRAYFGPASLLMDDEVMEALTPFGARVLKIEMMPDTFSNELEDFDDDLHKATDALRDHLYRTRTFRETTKQKDRKKLNSGQI